MLSIIINSNNKFGCVSRFSCVVKDHKAFHRKKEKETKKSVGLRGRWASVGGLVRSMSTKEGSEVCFEDLFQRRVGW